MKLKPGLGTSYTIRPGNGVGLFYSPRPTWGEQLRQWILKNRVGHSRITSKQMIQKHCNVTQLKCVRSCCSCSKMKENTNVSCHNSNNSGLHQTNWLYCTCFNDHFFQLYMSRASVLPQFFLLLEFYFQERCYSI